MGPKKKPTPAFKVELVYIFPEQNFKYWPNYGIHTAVQLCTALMFMYGVQSVLCCTEIMYSTIQMFIRLQIKLVCENFLNCVQFVLYRNIVKHCTNVLPCSNKLICTATAVMWPFYTFTKPLTQLIQKFTNPDRHRTPNNTEHRTEPKLEACATRMA